MRTNLSVADTHIHTQTRAQTHLLESAYLLWLSSGRLKCLAAWKLNTLLVSSRLQLSEIAFEVVMESMAVVFYVASLVARSPFSDYKKNNCAKGGRPRNYSRMILRYVHFILLLCVRLRKFHNRNNSTGARFVCWLSFRPAVFFFNSAYLALSFSNFCHTMSLWDAQSLNHRPRAQHIYSARRTPYTLHMHRHTIKHVLHKILEYGNIFHKIRSAHVCIIRKIHQRHSIQASRNACSCRRMQNMSKQHSFRLANGQRANNNTNVTTTTTKKPNYQHTMTALFVVSLSASTKKNVNNNGHRKKN